LASTIGHLVENGQGRRDPVDKEGCIFAIRRDAEAANLRSTDDRVQAGELDGHHPLHFRFSRSNLAGSYFLGKCRVAERWIALHRKPCIRRRLLFWSYAQNIY
jgi:hypothetical protein